MCAHIPNLSSFSQKKVTLLCRIWLCRAFQSKQSKALLSSQQLHIWRLLFLPSKSTKTHLLDYFQNVTSLISTTFSDSTLFSNIQGIHRRENFLRQFQKKKFFSLKPTSLGSNYFFSGWVEPLENLQVLPQIWWPLTWFGFRNSVGLLADELGSGKTKFDFENVMTTWQFSLKSLKSCTSVSNKRAGKISFHRTQNIFCYSRFWIL